jgi:E3 ubiquitin-protein ligase DOA10
VREMLRDKRGITPVISNLLLTVIAVAAMAIATTATYVITGNLRDTMGERFIIEDVWFKQNNETAIYLRNVGKVTIEIRALYINHTSQSFTPFELKVSEHGWLNVTYSWSSESVYHIYIYTDRGTKVAEYYKAP